MDQVGASCIMGPRPELMNYFNKTIAIQTVILFCCSQRASINHQPAYLPSLLSSPTHAAFGSKITTR
jgi:hypothetical protein